MVTLAVFTVGFVREGIDMLLAAGFPHPSLATALPTASFLIFLAAYVFALGWLRRSAMSRSSGTA